MSIFRSVLVCALISLLAGVALFFLGSKAGYEQFRGGYAVLCVDASSIEDRDLRSMLESGITFFGGSPVSESSQWVMLDVFGSYQQIPLDKYSSRVFPFDPRNDGYAEKLKDFFVREGKRYVFIPLLPGNWTETFLDGQFERLLRDIPFTVEYFGIGKPLAYYFLAYAAASVSVLVLCYIRKTLHHRIVNILTLIPLFSSFSFFGAEGIAASSLLFGIFFLLREPLYEIASMPGLFKGNLKKKFKNEIYQPYKIYWNSILLFVASLAVLVVFTPLKLLFLTVIFLTSLAVFFISSKILSSDEGSRRRFSPVAILGKRLPEFAFSVYMLPFTVAAFLIVFLTPLLPGSYTVDKKFDVSITEKDYTDHLAYQASFSTSQLGTFSFEYNEYSQGADGLPSVSKEGKTQSVNFSDFPLFPLKHLIDFLINVNNGTSGSVENSGGLKEKLALLVLLLFVIPGIFVKKNHLSKLRAKGVTMKATYQARSYKK